MNYIKKSWHGNVSLSKAFWLNYFGFTAFIIGAYLLIVFSVALSENIQLINKTYVIASSVMMILCYAILPWQTIGLWRSCEQHIKATGKKFWARLIQAIVCISLGFTVYGAPQQYKQLKDIFEVTYAIGFEKSQGKEELYAFSAKKLYKLKVSGSSLYINGLFQSGIAKDVEALIIKNPSIKVVVLDSPGGLITESKKLTTLISKHQLNTEAFGFCASACTDVFIAGKFRAINQNTVLGFHKGGVPGIEKNDWLKDQRQSDIEKHFFPFARKQGIKEEFIQAFTEKVLNSQGDPMWYPTVDEMLAMGLAHEIY
jgi:hypothetical protein